MMMYGKELSIVKELVAESGVIAMKFYRGDYSISEKSSKHDVVTEADMEIDDFLRTNLHNQFPSDQILSEENSSRPQGYRGRVWTVDPIDGTKYFVHEQGEFTIMVGLLEMGEPVLGVVYAPALDEWYYASRNGGSFHERDGETRRLCVNDVSKASSARLVTRCNMGESRPEDAIFENMPVKELIEAGSFGIKFGLIAEGRAEACISNALANKWDFCPPQIILEEAGGKVTLADGSALDYAKASAKMSRVIATNGKLHDEFVRLWKSTGLT